MNSCFVGNNNFTNLAEGSVVNWIEISSNLFVANQIGDSLFSLGKQSASGNLNTILILDNEFHENYIVNYIFSVKGANIIVENNLFNNTIFESGRAIVTVDSTLSMQNSSFLNSIGSLGTELECNCTALPYLIYLDHVTISNISVSASTSPSDSLTNFQSISVYGCSFYMYSCVFTDCFSSIDYLTTGMLINYQSQSIDNLYIKWDYLQVYNIDSHQAKDDSGHLFEIDASTSTNFTMILSNATFSQSTPSQKSFFLIRLDPEDTSTGNHPYSKYSSGDSSSNQSTSTSSNSGSDGDLTVDCRSIPDIQIPHGFKESFVIDPYRSMNEHNEIEIANEYARVLTHTEYQGRYHRNAQPYRTNPLNDPTISNTFYLLHCEFNEIDNIFNISGNFFISDCSFIGSSSDREDYGFSLSIEGGDFYNITSTTFRNHYKSTPVIIHQVELINFYNCTFENNTSRETGGSVQVLNGDSINFYNCSWLYNSAFQGGGAVTISNGNVLFDGSLFYNNTSILHDGGAILIDDFASVTINYCYFIANFAAYGGGISVNKFSFLEINHSTFDDNKSLQSAGGILLQNRIDNSVVLNNVTLINNQCYHGSGGGISFHFNTSPMIIDCLISNNTATSGGGIAVTDLSRPIFQSTIIQYNDASSSGGGVVIQGLSTPFFNQSTILSNFANSTGGGILVKDLAKPTFANCLIKENTCPNEGGGVIFTDKSISTLNDTHILYNTAGASGGALAFAITSSGTFTNCVIESNFATSSGGAVSFHNNCHPSFSNCTLFQNIASEGGAISIEDLADPRFLHCNITSNTAFSHGGAILASDYSLGVFSDCLFLDNTARSGRGGVIKSNDFSKTLFTNSVLYNNSAENGGAVYGSSTYGPFMTNSDISFNHARSRGGALCFAGRSSALFVACNITGNTANESGGAIFTQDASLPYFENARILNNSVTVSSDSTGEGGAISIYDESRPTFNNTLFQSNIGIVGGAIYLHELTQAQFVNVTCEGNIALSYGGCVYFRSLFTQFLNCTFSNNYGASGGAFFIDIAISQPNDYICANCLFQGNNATFGGGVYVKTPFDILNSHTNQGNDPYYPSSTSLYPISPLPTPTTPFEYQSEHPLTGSAIFTVQKQENTRKYVIEQENGEQDVIFAFYNPVFIENTAERGGGIYYYASLSFLKFGPQVIIANNTAAEFGGGIYISQLNKSISTTWMVGGIFENNLAYYAGCNVAWTATSMEAASLFCESCSFGSSSSLFHGYQLAQGWATIPSQLYFYESFMCPATNYVANNGAFEVATILQDDFGTPVIGNIDTSNNITVSLSIVGSCELISGDSAVLVDDETAVSHFQNLTLQAKNDISCQLLFSTPIIRNAFVLPAVCNISIYGCPLGQSVSYDNTSAAFDSCVPGIFPLRSFSFFSLLFLLLLSLFLSLSFSFLPFLLLSLFSSPFSLLFSSFSHSPPSPPFSLSFSFLSLFFSFLFPLLSLSFSILSFLLLLSPFLLSLSLLVTFPISLFILPRIFPYILLPFLLSALLCFPVSFRFSISFFFPVGTKSFLEVFELLSFPSYSFILPILHYPLPLFSEFQIPFLPASNSSPALSPSFLIRIPLPSLPPLPPLPPFLID